MEDRDLAAFIDILGLSNVTAFMASLKKMGALTYSPQQHAYVFHGKVSEEVMHEAVKAAQRGETI